MRDHPQQREAIHALLAQEIGRVTVVLLQQEDEQRAAVDLLRAGGSGMDDGTFDDAIEADRGFGLDRFLSRHRGEGTVEHLVEVLAQLGEVDTAGRQQLARLRIFDQRIKEMLETDEVVPPVGGEPERATDTLERFGRERNRCAAHARCSSGSGSIVTSSGYSCCSARRLVAFTFVSATSLV